MLVLGVTMIRDRLLLLPRRREFQRPLAAILELRAAQVHMTMVHSQLLHLVLLRRCVLGHRHPRPLRLTTRIKRMQ